MSSGGSQFCGVSRRPSLNQDQMGEAQRLSAGMNNQLSLYTNTNASDPNATQSTFMRPPDFGPVSNPPNHPAQWVGNRPTYYSPLHSSGLLVRPVGPPPSKYSQQPSFDQKVGMSSFNAAGQTQDSKPLEPLPPARYDSKRVQDFDFVSFEYISAFANVRNRDIPSAITAQLFQLNRDGAGPQWEHLLQYFATQDASFSKQNCLHLYMLLSTVLLPRAISRNRELILSLYNSRGDTPARIWLRYDEIKTEYSNTIGREASHVQCYEDSRGSSAIHPMFPESTSPRNAMGAPQHVFQDKSLADGAMFLRSLQSPPPDRAYMSCFVAHKMRHRRTRIDEYVQPSMADLSYMELPFFTEAISQMLRIWYEIWEKNHLLIGYSHVGWYQVDVEFQR